MHLRGFFVNFLDDCIIGYSLVELNGDIVLDGLGKGGIDV